MVVNHYEHLRHAYLEARAELPGALGLTVLLRHGLLAWSRLCATTLSAGHAPTLAADQARVPASWPADIVPVMVTMAMGRWAASSAGEGYA